MMTRFRIDLIDGREAVGANGAVYQYSPMLDHSGNPDSAWPAIRREWRDDSENIVGFNGLRFDSAYQAIQWAEQDQRLEMRIGATVPEREPIADLTEAQPKLSAPR